MIRLTTSVVAFCITQVAAAQELSCENLSQATQLQMNQCSYQAYQYADQDLNLAYELAQETLMQVDAGIIETYGQAPEGYQSGAIALRDAQKAWIKYRDLSCAAEGTLYYGGSIRPLVENTCKEKLTRIRTEELRRAFEQN